MTSSDYKMQVEVLIPMPQEIHIQSIKDKKKYMYICMYFA